MELLIYFASALFSSRETRFNAELARRLESSGAGARVLLPQRHGFEFSSLGQLLARQLGERDTAMAVASIIYTLDMGGFLSRSDAVVAVLDEPLDDGVLVEISYARRLGIPVVGVRTDTRSPYGNVGDPLGGIHFFAAFQCSAFILAPPVSTDEGLDELARAVWECLRCETAAERGAGDPVLERAAARLFEGVDVLRDDLHDPAVLARVVDNYLADPGAFSALAPRLEGPAVAEAAPAHA